MTTSHSNCSHDHHVSLKSEIDPVCGMKVDPMAAKGGSSFYQGQKYYFCNPKCKTKFDADPESILKPKAAAKPQPLDVEYTCPMHPEVRQIGPGSCPFCGMALEPLMFSLDHKEDQSEYFSMRKRLWISTLLSGPLLFITMGGRHLIESVSGPSFSSYLEVALATPVVLWGALPFFERFWQSLKNKSPNMFTLIGLGVGVAYGFSLVAILFPEIFPSSFKDPMTGQVGLYFEPAAVIVTLVLLGQVLELKARGQTGAAIKALLGLTPKTARRINNDETEEEIQIRLFNVLPLRTNIIGKNICIDTCALISNFLEDKKISIPLKNYKEGDNQYNLWNRFFKLDKQHFQCHTV